MLGVYELQEISDNSILESKFMINTGRSILILAADEFSLDRRIGQQANYFAATGFQVHLALLVGALVLPSNLDARVSVYCSDYVTPSIGAWARVREALKSNTTILGAYHYLASFRAPAKAWLKRLRGLALPETDIVLANDLPCLIAALETYPRGKVVFDAHEIYEEQYDAIYAKRLAGYWRKQAESYIPKAAATMTVTSAVADFMQKRYELQRASYVLENACNYVPPQDLDATAVRRLYEIPTSQSIVLCLGHLRESRGLEDYVEALPHLDENAVLVFVGPGSLSFMERLSRRARYLGVTSRLKIGKQVPPDQIVNIASGANIGVISFRGNGPNYELGGPNRLYEYIQARIPIFAFRHAGIASLLDDTGTGVCEQWSTAADLAKKLNAALYASNEIPSWKFERAARLYSYERNQGNLADLVSHCIGRRDQSE